MNNVYSKEAMLHALGQVLCNTPDSQEFALAIFESYVFADERNKRVDEALTALEEAYESGEPDVETRALYWEFLAEGLEKLQAPPDFKITQEAMAKYMWNDAVIEGAPSVCEDYECWSVQSLGEEMTRLAADYDFFEQPAEISRKYLVEVDGLNGEYSFVERILLHVPAGDPTEAAENLLSIWWDGMYEENGAHFTSDGCVRLSLVGVKPISGRLFNTLSELGFATCKAGDDAAPLKALTQ